MVDARFLDQHVRKRGFISPAVQNVDGERFRGGEPDGDLQGSVIDQIFPDPYRIQITDRLQREPAVEGPLPREPGVD